jgi:hypothetical protein
MIEDGGELVRVEWELAGENQVLGEHTRNFFCYKYMIWSGIRPKLPDSRCSIGICVEALRKTKKTSVWIVGIPVENRTLQLQNTSQKHYSFSQLLVSRRYDWEFYLLAASSLLCPDILPSTSFHRHTQFLYLRQFLLCTSYKNRSGNMWHILKIRNIIVWCGCK